MAVEEITILVDRYVPRVTVDDEDVETVTHEVLIVFVDR